MPRWAAGTFSSPFLPGLAPRRSRGPQLPLLHRISDRSAPAWAVTTAKLASLPLLALLLAASAPAAGWATAPLSLTADAAATDAQGEVPEGVSRWLWWPLILYLFWAMAFTCDEYFVRTIDVISERFEIPDDVAGATLMALGCNGPELALNMISIFHESNIGVGAVIGGEVFNVLVIIGTALLATPSAYMPLKIGRFTFGRDVFFYAVSVGLLWYVLRDSYVTVVESMMMICGGVLYVTTVIFSAKLRDCLRRTNLVRQNSWPLRLPSRTSTGDAADLVDGDGSDSSSDEDFEMVDFWEKGFECLDPRQGSVMGVRMDIRNRMMDKNHHYDDRYICLGEDALLLSTAKDPRKHHAGHASLGMVYDYRGTHHHHWHHGGLVNEPIYLQSTAPLATPSQANGATAAAYGGANSGPLEPQPQQKQRANSGLLEPQPQHSAQVFESPSFKEFAVEVIYLEDVLYVEKPRDHKHFNLHVQHHNNESAGMVTLEFRANSEDMIDAWAAALMVKLIDQRRRTADPPAEKHGLALVMQWLEWFQFPVKFWLHMTIPDMDHPDRQHLYPVSFVMSMFWLAIFAFSVVSACDGIHDAFGISTKVLGFTVAAGGTSFPNVFSGIVVAKQGKTTMAVANALGANVQNVFLALAIPWAIKACFINRGPFRMHVADLDVPILWCYITLLPVLAVYFTHKGTMPRWSGGFFLILYVIYLVFALGEDITNCPKWPLHCS